MCSQVHVLKFKCMYMYMYIYMCEYTLPSLAVNDDMSVKLSHLLMRLLPIASLSLYIGGSGCLCVPDLT